MRPWRTTLGILVVGLLAPGSTAQAQCTKAVRLIGSAAEDRWRIAQITGDSALDPTSVVRSNGECRGVRTPGLTNPGFDWTFVTNGGMPDTRNEGTFWAGRGVSTRVRGGIIRRWASVDLVLMPELLYSENRGYEVAPSSLPNRTVWQFPWYGPPYGLDLPQRQGSARIRQFSLGQSSVTVHARGVALSLGTQDEWWGPGIRNALLLSNNGSAMPHLTVRPDVPWRTAFGVFDARLLVGDLVESLYFRTDSLGLQRSLSAAAVTWTPPSSGLTVGVMRGVMRAIPSAGGVAGSALDALTRWDRVPPPGSTDTARIDQITSLFGRWVVPSAGAEFHGEWARNTLPTSLHEWLTAPTNAAGFTFGTQFVRPWRNRRIRTQFEFTNLDQVPILTDAMPRDFYSGAADPHGWTSGGKVLGAGIGPGGSSQFIGVDLLDAKWSHGVTLERVRFNNDAFYRQVNPYPNRHDIAITAGWRSVWHWADVDLTLDARLMRRWNYLFQNNIYYLGTRTINVTSPNVRFGFNWRTPFAPLR